MEDYNYTTTPGHEGFRGYWKEGEQVGMMMADMANPSDISDIAFAALVNTFVKSSWKSKTYFNGEPIKDGSFIVGIDTPKGIFARYYNDSYWNLIHAEEIAISFFVSPEDLNSPERLLCMGAQLENDTTEEDNNENKRKTYR